MPLYWFSTTVHLKWICGRQPSSHEIWLKLSNRVAFYSVPQVHVTSGPDKRLVKQGSFHYPEIAEANKSWIKDQQKITNVYAYIIHQRKKLYGNSFYSLQGEGMATDRIDKQRF